MQNSGLDEQGAMMGIDHERFEQLRDSKGNGLAIDQSYAVYNTFIDFHSFVHVFGLPSRNGAGIQDLKTFGQKILHSAAHSEPPVNLGSRIAKGSTFKNGEISLELKGISTVGDASAALVGFDSGESSFTMIVLPMPGMEVRTTGGSHYRGDLYVDLATLWPVKVVMEENVVSETVVPASPAPIHSVIERKVTIRKTNAG